MENASCAEVHVRGINGRQNEKNVVHEARRLFYASPVNGSNQCTRSVHMKQTPTLYHYSHPRPLCTRVIPWRHVRAPAGAAASRSRIQYGGEDCLSEASPAALTFRVRGKGTRRAAPGRPWFWVLLPKQKDRGVRGRNPARIPPQAFGVTVKRRVPMRVISLASYPTKMSMRYCPGVQPACDGGKNLRYPLSSSKAR